MERCGLVDSCGGVVVDSPTMADFVCVTEL